MRMSLVALKPPDPSYPSHAYSVTHPSPTYAPAAPCSPLHCCILIHLSSLEILLRKLPLSAELLISLILRRATDVDQVLRRVRDDVVGSSVFLDLGYLANLELL